MCYVMCVGGGLGERMIRHVTSARQKEEGQCVSRMGAVQCEECRRWFRSRGGLAMHRCRREEVVENDAAGGVGAGVSQERVECRECGRTFSRQGDLKRHKCLDERNKPSKEQRGSLQCSTCERWFKSAGELSVLRKKLYGSRQQLNLPPPNKVGHMTQLGSG